MASSAGVMTTGGVFSQAVSASVRALWDLGVKDVSSRLYGNELFTTFEPKAKSQQLANISGPAYGVLTQEGQEYGENSLYKGYAVTLSLRKFTSKLSWTEEDVFFIAKQKESGVKDFFTFSNPVTHAMNALIGSMNLDLAKIFYLGFGTTNFTGGDAVALFSNSHPIRRDGSTSGNMFASTHDALSVDAVKGALDRMNRAKDNNGVQFAPVKRFRIVVPVELEAKAWQILDSMYGPSANLGLSLASPAIMEKRGIPDRGVTVLPDIPSAYSTYWFIVDLDRAALMNFKALAWGPRMDDFTHVESGVHSNNASVLLQHVPIHWAHVFGSKGDGSAV